MYASPFEADARDDVPVVVPSPFGAAATGRISSPLPSGNRHRQRDTLELRYHYGDDRDHVVMGKDLYEERHTLSCNVSWACVFSAVLELSVLAWPITAFSVWGFELDTIYTLVFAIHLFKAIILIIKTFSNTLVFRMRGRNTYHWFWGIWTRASHVHQDPLLYAYAILYGWIQIPMMCLFILVAAASYPLYTHMVPYWINWSMAIVSLVLGYIAWCILISERSIRMELDKRVDFTQAQRQRTIEQKSRRSSYLNIPGV